MQLRRLAPTTQRGYTHYVADFAKFYNTAFLAKPVPGLQTTRPLLDRLQVDTALGSLCELQLGSGRAA